MSRHEPFSAAGIGRAHPAEAAPARPRTLRIASVALIRDLRRLQLWAELVLLFVGVPLLMAVYWPRVLAWGALGAFALITILAGLALLAAVLLAITPGFSFRRLLNGPVFREWRLILAYSGLTAAACLVVVFGLLPQHFLNLPIEHTPLWVAIMVAYPIGSALPQELIYRVLFFERYGALFPGALAAALANGVAFGFGHLFYMHSVTIAMTAVGGALIGWAYLTRGRSVMLVWVLHSLAGQIIFTSGIGVYFYSGVAGPIS